MRDRPAWLENLALSRYQEVFAENEINAERAVRAGLATVGEVTRLKTPDE